MIGDYKELGDIEYDACTLAGILGIFVRRKLLIINLMCDQ